jgi:hypothetical protein
MQVLYSQWQSLPQQRLRLIVGYRAFWPLAPLTMVIHCDVAIAIAIDKDAWLCDGGPLCRHCNKDATVALADTIHCGTLHL